MCLSDPPVSAGSRIVSEWDRELRALIKLKAEIRVANVALCAKFGIKNHSTINSKIEPNIKLDSQLSPAENAMLAKGYDSLEHQYTQEIKLLDQHLAKLRLHIDKTK